MLVGLSGERYLLLTRSKNNKMSQNVAPVTNNIALLDKDVNWWLVLPTPTTRSEISNKKNNYIRSSIAEIIAKLMMRTKGDRCK